MSKYFIKQGLEYLNVEANFKEPIIIPISKTRCNAVAFPKYKNSTLNNFIKNLPYDSLCRYDANNSEVSFNLN